MMKSERWQKQWGVDYIIPVIIKISQKMKMITKILLMY